MNSQCVVLSVAESRPHPHSLYVHLAGYMSLGPPGPFPSPSQSLGMNPHPYPGPQKTAGERLVIGGHVNTGTSNGDQNENATTAGTVLSAVHALSHLILSDP